MYLSQTKVGVVSNRAAMLDAGKLKECDELLAKRVDSVEHISQQRLYILHIHISNLNLTL